MRYGEDLVVGAEGDPVYSAVPFAYEAGLEGVRVPLQVSVFQTSMS